MNRRRFMMSSGNKFNYVTDGLIGMYDGIYNKAIGQHDNTITKWYDLSGNNRNFTLSKAAWDNNSLYISQADYTNVQGSLSSYYGFITAEFVIQVDYIENTQYDEACILMGMEGLGLICQFKPNHVFIFFTYTYNGERRFATNYYGYKTLGDKIIIQVVINPNYLESTQTEGWRCFVEGIETAMEYTNIGLTNSPGLNTHNARRFAGHIYAMRFYNRALSESELHQNYMIDKKRFDVLDKTASYDAKVEYLAVPSVISKAYIDTDVCVANDVDFEIKFRYPTIVTTAQGSNMGTVFGGRQGWNLNVFELTTYNKNTSSVGHFAYAGQGWNNANTPVASIIANTILTCKKEGRVFTAADGTETNLPDSTFSKSNIHIMIFALQNDTEVYSWATYLQVLSMKFYKNNFLIRDYIPVRKNGVGYLYDKVYNKLYGNANTEGEFIIGPDETT